MSERVIRVQEPNTPPSDRTHKFVNQDDGHYKMKDDQGKITFVTGITGLVRVNKVVRDAALESPGNELDSELPGQRYLILTNGGDGNRAAGWGSIDNAEGIMLIERTINNFEWLVQNVVSDGVGKFIVFDESDTSLWIYTGQGWRRYADGSHYVRPELSAGTDLQPGKFHKITGSDTYTLPLASDYKGQSVKIKFMDNSTSGPTIDTTGSDLIEFTSVFIFNSAYQYEEFFSDGTQWLKLG